MEWNEIKLPFRCLDILYWNKKKNIYIPYHTLQIEKEEKEGY